MKYDNTQISSAEIVTIVTDVFPSPYFPERGAFNANLALEFAKQKVTVSVVACNAFPRRTVEALIRKERNLWDFSKMCVRNVPFVALGRWCLLSPKLRAQITQLSLRRSIEKSLNKNKQRSGVVYAIFLENGMACLKWCKLNKVPLFLELPESGIEAALEIYGSALLRELLNSCCGIIADSVDNQRFCLELDPRCEAKVIYVPNGADTNRFRPIDKGYARRKLGLPEDEQIVVFCGHFIERKGPLRVLEALRSVGKVKGVFLGRGKQVPSGPQVLRAAPVSNVDLPLWMNAGDVFVLPSLAEGLANVIVEAMACGLPLVVSDRSFNRNFLTDECALFVDPNSPRAIGIAIQTIFEDSALRSRMGTHSLVLSHEYSMSKRVAKIRTFMNMVSPAQQNGVLLAY